MALYNHDMKELFIAFSYFSKRQRFFFLDLFLLRQDMLSVALTCTYIEYNFAHDLVEYVFHIAKVVSISL